MINIDKSINKILGNKKKVKGASIKKQNQWKNMSMSQRNNARKKYKDSDGDRIPNIFDCNPFNTMKQDTNKYMQSRRPIYEKKNSSWWDINTKPKQQKYSPDLEDNDDNNKMIMFAIRKRMREKAEKEAYENEVINNINMQVRELGTSLKKKKNPADRLMSDTDGDGVANVMDCDPNDKTKQGPTHNYYNYTQIAKHSVRNRGEINRQGSCLGHCAQLSSDIYHNLSAGHTEAKTINVDLYNDEPIRHKAVYVPKDDVVIDTQVWQFTNDNNKNLRNRKVVFTPEEYEDLGFTIEDKRTI